MSSTICFKLKYKFNKENELKLFDFFDKCFNTDEVPKDDFFNNFNDAILAKKIFLSVKNYNIPENVYTDTYSDDELESIAQLIKSDMETKDLYVHNYNKYNSYLECKGNINQIKKVITDYPLNKFMHTEGELSINAEISSNDIWMDDVIQFLNLHRDLTKALVVASQFQEGGVTVSAFLEGNEYVLCSSSAIAPDDDLYDYNGFYIYGNSYDTIAPHEIPVVIDWLDVKDALIVDKYIKCQREIQSIKRNNSPLEDFIKHNGILAD